MTGIYLYIVFIQISIQLNRKVHSDINSINISTLTIEHMKRSVNYS